MSNTSMPADFWDRVAREVAARLLAERPVDVSGRVFKQQQQAQDRARLQLDEEIRRQLSDHAQRPIPLSGMNWMNSGSQE